MVTMIDRPITQATSVKAAKPRPYWQQQIATIIGSYTEPEANPVVDIFADAGLSMIKRTAASNTANQKPAYLSSSSARSEHESIMAYVASEASFTYYEQED